MKETEHIIAFIDIIGFSNEVENYIKNNNKNFVNNLNSAITKIENDVKNEIKKNYDKKNNFKINYKIFSDSIIIFTNLDILNEIRYFEIAKYFQSISKIIKIFLKLNILVRGGISIGKGYISSNIIFSNALINAVNIEKNESIYPRIILDEIIIQEIKNFYNIILN